MRARLIQKHPVNYPGTFYISCIKKLKKKTNFQLPMYKGCPKKTVADPRISEQCVNVSWQPCGWVGHFILKPIKKKSTKSVHQWPSNFHHPNTAASTNINAKARYTLIANSSEKLTKNEKATKREQCVEHFRRRFANRFFVLRSAPSSLDGAVSE